MALHGSREVVIESSLEGILDALADVAAMPSWLPVYKQAEVLDRYADGRPHHVKVIAKFMGVVDPEVLEYHWGPNWVVWDAASTPHVRALHAEYTFEPRLDGTHVHFNLTLEQGGMRAAVVSKWAQKFVLDGATDGLCDYVAAQKTIVDDAE